MRTTKKVVIELDPGDVIEVVARFERDGKEIEARVTLEHDIDLGHPQLRADFNNAGQVNLLHKNDDLDEAFADRAISVFI